MNRIQSRRAIALSALLLAVPQAHAQSPYNADGTIAGGDPCIGRVPQSCQRPSPQQPTPLPPASVYNPSAPYGYGPTGAPLQAPVQPSGAIDGAEYEARKAASTTGTTLTDSQFCAANPATPYCSGLATPTGGIPRTQARPLALPGSGVDAAGQYGGYQYGGGRIRPYGVDRNAASTGEPDASLMVASYPGKAPLLTWATQNASNVVLLCAGPRGYSVKRQLAASGISQALEPDSRTMADGVYRCALIASGLGSGRISKAESEFSVRAITAPDVTIDATVPGTVASTKAKAPATSQPISSAPVAASSDDTAVTGKAFTVPTQPTVHPTTSPVSPITSTTTDMPQTAVPQPGTVASVMPLTVAMASSSNPLPAVGISLAQTVGEAVRGVRLSLGTNTAANASVTCRGGGGVRDVRVPSNVSGTWVITGSDMWTPGIYSCQVTALDANGQTVQQETKLTIR